MRLALLTIGLVGCGAGGLLSPMGSRCPEGTTPAERGVERWCEDAQGEWDGPYERVDATGAVVERGRFRHGKKAGAWSMPENDRAERPDEMDRWVRSPPPDAAQYDLPGDAVATVSADGVRTVTQHGVRIAEGRFLDDVPVGVHRAWGADGKLRSEIPHDSEGRPDGVGTRDGETVRWDRGERVTPQTTSREDR